MNKQRVTLITLGVSDMTVSRKFYAALGWVAEKSPPEVTFYHLNGMKLGLFGKEDLARDVGLPLSSLGTGTMVLSQNYNTKKEVDEAFEMALKAGANQLKHPADTFWGGYAGHISDPDGHIWEYAMNPYWNLDDEGYIT